MAAAAFNYRKWMRAVIFWLGKLNASKSALQTLFSQQDLQCI